MANQVITQTQELKHVKVGNSEFLFGQTNDGCDVYVWQNGYDNNLVQITKNGHLVEQQTGSMSEVVEWLAPLGVYDNVS